MNLGKNILKEIKKDKIKPRAKWVFIFKNILVWSLGALSLIISSLSVSVIIDIINNNDYLFLKIAHPSPIGLIIRSLPYFWIISMIIFVIIFRYSLKQTKNGYKLEVYKIIIISIFLSIILGVFFYTQNIGNNIDCSFAKKSSFYNQMMKPRHLIWLQEDQGVLAGKIISIIDQNNFNLEDFNKKQWKIIRSENKFLEPKFKKMAFSEINLRPGLEIRVIGQEINENTFQAFLIKPAPGRYYNYPAKKPFRH